MLSSQSVRGYRTIRHTRIAHNQLQKSGSDFFDIKDAKVKFGDERRLLSKLQGLVKLLLLIVRHVDFEWGTAVRIEEKAVEQRLCGFQCRRLARPHNAINIDQRVLASGVLVDRERVADIGTDRDVIDIQHRQFADPGLRQLRKGWRGDLVTGFEIDLTGLFIDQIGCEIPADQFLFDDEDVAKPFLTQPPGIARRQTLARCKNDLAGAGIAQIARQLTLEILFPEWRHPPLSAAAECDCSIKAGENLFLGHAARLARLQRATVDVAAHPQFLISGAYFNTGSGTFQDDVQAYVMIERRTDDPSLPESTLRVAAFMSVGTTFFNNVDLGTVQTGEEATLSLTWNRASKTFVAQIVRQLTTPLVEQQTMPYSQADSLPPSFLFRQIQVGTYVPNCTSNMAFAAMKAKIEAVSVNAAAF